MLDRLIKVMLPIIDTCAWLGFKLACVYLAINMAIGASKAFGNCSSTRQHSWESKGRIGTSGYRLVTMKQSLLINIFFTKILYLNPYFNLLNRLCTWKNVDLQVILFCWLTLNTQLVDGYGLSFYNLTKGPESRL